MGWRNRSIAAACTKFDVIRQTRWRLEVEVDFKRWWVLEWILFEHFPKNLPFFLVGFVSLSGWQTRHVGIVDLHEVCTWLHPLLLKATMAEAAERFAKNHRSVYAFLANHLLSGFAIR